VSEQVVRPAFALRARLSLRLSRHSMAATRRAGSPGAGLAENRDFRPYRLRRLPVRGLRPSGHHACDLGVRTP